MLVRQMKGVRIDGRDDTAIQGNLKIGVIAI